MNNANILTHPSSNALHAKTSETTPKEQISPAEVPKNGRLNSMSMPDLIQKANMTSGSDQNKTSESVKDGKEAQTNKQSQQTQKLNLTKLTSNTAASAFTPVFKNNPIQTTNNALKSFLQAHNEAVKTESPQSVKTNSESKLNSSRPSNLQVMIEKRVGCTDVGSNQMDSSAKDKFAKPLNILRPNQTGFTPQDQEPVTPTSATLQNLSRLATCLQMQNSALMNKNVSMTSPIGAKTPTQQHLLNVLSGIDQVKPSQLIANLTNMPGTPGQKNLSQVTRNTPGNDISPTLKASLGLQLCTPTQRHSLTQRDPFTPSVFLRPAKIGQKQNCDSNQKDGIASPEFLQNAILYRQLSGLIQQHSQTSDQNAAHLKQLFTQAQASQVSFDKFDQQFNFQNTLESFRKTTDQQFDQKPATPLQQDTLPIVSQKQETILDRPDAERKLNSVSPVSNSKTGKSGKGRQPVEVIEQESELTKVKYNISANNTRAVFVAGLGIIDDYMASEDLNECVDALLLKRSKAAFEQHAAAIASAKKLAEAKNNAATDGSTSIGLSPGKTNPNSVIDGQCSEERKMRNKRQSETARSSIPKVVIRHRVKGAKQVQKRLRKNTVQNKILMNEFQKNPQWSKKKIQQLHERLGLKQSQIYKWNWDMLRKTGQGDTSQNDHSRNQGFTAPFDESGSDMQLDCSDEQSLMSHEEDDADMDDLSEGQEQDV